MGQSLIKQANKGLSKVVIGQYMTNIKQKQVKDDDMTRMLPDSRHSNRMTNFQPRAGNSKVYAITRACSSASK